MQGLKEYSDGLDQNSHNAGTIRNLLEKTGSDCRYHDELDPVGQVGCRFNSTIHGVEKPSKGPLRSFLKAKHGYKFVRADYEQQEVRLIAALANDPEYLSLFKSGREIYAEIAKELGNGLPSSQVISRDVAKEKMSSFVMTKSGRKRWLSGPDSDGSIINHVMQWTAAGGFKGALVEIDKTLEGYNARIVHIMHDEVIVEAEETIADQILAIVQTCMERTFEELFPDMPFPVKPEISDSWGDSNSKKPVHPAAQVLAISAPLATISHCYDCIEWTEGEYGHKGDLCWCNGEPMEIFEGMAIPDLCVMI